MKPLNQETLYRLDTILTKALISYSTRRLNRFKAGEELDILKAITFGEKKPYLQLDKRLEALEKWLDEDAPALPKDCLDKNLLDIIDRCLHQIGIYYSGEIDYSEMQSAIFNRKQAARVAAALRNLLIESSQHSGFKFTPMGFEKVDDSKNRYRGINGKKPGSDELLSEFRKTLERQMELLNADTGNGAGIFAVVDNILYDLELKPDIEIWHLANSLISFLEIRGYDIGQFASRLPTTIGQEND